MRKHRPAMKERVHKTSLGWVLVFFEGKNFRGLLERSRLNLNGLAREGPLSSGLGRGCLRSDTPSRSSGLAGGNGNRELWSRMLILGLWVWGLIRTARPSPCRADGGRDAWLPRSTVRELTLSRKVLTTLSCPLERANDSGVWFW